eukprot:CAMPEP_0119081878 /NCGR_PEP_ID=MMETSP1178-20130426/118784_1 /TAXON_ID=33656 /ORGANISM="unid sp, Strain CCMP2000" /LENGTH=86 /DNA_ID=CAMNT_0007064609 /DNA_START=8 /DNA_END=265 /DNA_ORIENTATION=-
MRCVGALAASLPSAGFDVWGSAGALRNVHRREDLSRGRMDPYGLVKVRLGGTAPHSHREPLRHLACMRPAHVKSDDPVCVCCVDYQ